MDRNSIGYIRYMIVLLALSAIFGGIAAASVESAVPARAQEAPKDSSDPGDDDDESTDGRAVEEQAGFNTLEDMLLFQGPLATLWAAPQSVTASVKWLEVTPEPAAEGGDSVADKSEE